MSGGLNRFFTVIKFVGSEFIVCGYPNFSFFAIYKNIDDHGGDEKLIYGDRIEAFDISPTTKEIFYISSGRLLCVGVEDSEESRLITDKLPKTKLLVVTSNNYVCLRTEDKIYVVRLSPLQEFYEEIEIINPFISINS